MSGSSFDTSVLVYIASGDSVKADQVAIAGGGAIGVQVLNELTNVARRKMRMSCGYAAAGSSFPQDVAGRLVEALQTIARDPEIVRLFANLGIVSVGTTQQEPSSRSAGTCRSVQRSSTWQACG